MKKIIFLAVLILLFPFVLAFDCNIVTDPNYCNSLANITEEQKDLIYSLLLYENHTYPDHDFIKDYNQQISVTAKPYNTPQSSSTYVKNMWVTLLSIHPSVYENSNLYVPTRITLRSEYDYQIELPEDYESGGYPDTNNGDCKRTYHLDENIPTVRYYFNNVYKGSGKTATFDIDSNGILKTWLNVQHKIRIEHYEWERYCCSWDRDGCIRYCNDCEHHHTSEDVMSSGKFELKELNLYTTRPSTDVTFVNQYYDTTKGIYYAQNHSQFKLEFPESDIVEQTKYYDVVFENKPYYFAYLRARDHDELSFNNLHLDNQTFFVKTPTECTISAYNHFYEITEPCDMTLHPEEESELTFTKRQSSLRLFYYTLLLLIIIYLLYKLIQSQWKKLIIPLIGLVFIPSSFATDCGLTNLASCIPEKIYEFILLLINAPLLPMITEVQALLTADVYTEAFYHTWSVIRYILGFFYVFLFLYAGYIFLISNSNPIRRSQAKDMLKNVIIMMILIQASFYLYNLILTLSSIMNQAILGMIDPHFFMLTADSIVNIGLEFFFALTYAIVLFTTMLMLALRYLVVCFGVILMPLGLFCYFIPPLKGYGKFILSLLGIFIFITFVDLLIILGCSMLIEIPLFANMKILVMINCFTLVNYSLWLAVKFALKTSATSSLKNDLSQTAKYIALIA